MELRYRHLAAATAGLTFVLILLGVYTAAAGAGLACGRNWPLCDGAVLGLFPANWPSFIEWFHRLVAMITGVMILGTAYGAWRYDLGRPIRAASTLALVVLPVQLILGLGTVKLFIVPVQVAHHAAALVIFASLVVTTTLAFASGSTTATATETRRTTSADDQGYADD